MPSVSVRVLGCSGAIAAGCHTTAFLLDASVLIDAGTGVGDLSLDELTRIDAVLLSHSHLDHVLGIPLLADAVMRRRRAAGRGPMQVYGLPETLEALRQHLFNGVIWPDFTRLPSPEEPALQLRPIAVGERLRLGARVVEVLPARHTVPACGFAVRHLGEERWWIFSGDTGPQPAALAAPARVVRQSPGHRDRLQRRRGRTGQPGAAPLPALAARRADAFRPGTGQVWLTHIKPGELRAVMQGLQGLVRPPQPLLGGQCFQLD
jgi:glyoxylase-like metal-dependent hydrolase (beta-lactamase superfamily II)